MFDDLSPPYGLILADPPWRFASNSKAKPGRNAMRHYPCMTVAEIAALPVRDIAARPSMLYLWATVPHMQGAIEVMQCWGFRYVSSLVWVKSRIGTGFWVRNRHEIILIGKHGRFPCPRPAHVDSVIESPQREHSRKPDALHIQIDAAYPDTRKLELFARQRRLGWDIWGAEADRFEGTA